MNICDGSQGKVNNPVWRCWENMKGRIPLQRVLWHARNFSRRLARSVFRRAMMMRFSEGSARTYYSLLNKSVNPSPNSPSKNVSSHRFLFYSKLVTYSNRMPWLFRCPSPCWVPFHQAQHSWQSQSFACHCLHSPHSLPAIIRLALHCLYP